MTSPRTQLEMEIAEIRSTVRDREAWMAKLQDPPTQRHRERLDRLRAIEARLVNELAALPRSDRARTARIVQHFETSGDLTDGGVG
jgi:hypothetical protein